MNERLDKLQALLARADRALRANVRSAKRDLARLARLRPSISTAFHEMGALLVRLRSARVARALGHADLYALAAAHAGLGRRDVADLVAIAASLTKSEARVLGWRLAAAYVALGRAAERPPFVLYERGLPSRRGIALARGERRVRIVLEAAKALRHRTNASRAGRSTTAEERAAASRLSALLARSGHAATVQAIATRPGLPATFRIVDLDAAALACIDAALARVLTSPRAGRRPAASSTSARGGR